MAQSKHRVGGKREPSLKAAFLQRARAAVEEVADRLQANELQQAVAAPTRAGSILVALSHPSVVGILTPDDPLAKARLRGIQPRDELLAQDGGTFSSVEVAKRLRITRQAVDQRRKSGQLLAVGVGRRGYLYPARQFDEAGVRSGFAEILAALRHHPPLAQARFFLSGNHRLDGQRPLDRLRSGDTSHALRRARAFGG